MAGENGGADLILETGRPDAGTDVQLLAFRDDTERVIWLAVVHLGEFGFG